MEASATVAAPAADPLTAFAAKRNNELCDVVALLHAVEDRIEAAQSISAHDPMHQTLRLVQMARERIDEIANELFEYQ
jgi:hypothetical protein